MHLERALCIEFMLDIVRFLMSDITIDPNLTLFSKPV